MKKIARFMVRLVLFVIAMVVMAPALLIFVECESTFLPNFLGLAYVLCVIALYKTSDEDEFPKKVVEIYRIAFREFFPDL